MDAQMTQTRRAVSAAVIGNVLEWYDFSVYAFVAVIIARKFFPSDNEVSALLATFLAYGLGFVARPLGGIILGRVGDTHGRKTALLITIALMAIGTVLVGILPTYTSCIGAPLVPLDLGIHETMDIWLTYHPDARHIPRVARLIDWVIESFSPVTHPWFRNEFIHPDKLTGIYGPEQSTPTIRPFRPASR